MSPLICCLATIGFHLASYHSAPGYNNNNPGVYLKNQSGYTVGGYHNSEGRPSFYAGRTFEKQLASWLSADLTVGGITGYRRGKLLPMLVPSVKLPLAGNASLRLAYLPRIEKKGSHTAHVAIEFAL